MPRDPFYVSWEWKKVRLQVLKMDKYECQRCKTKGKYKKANTVHHIKPRKEYPEFELEIYYIDTDGKKKRNLISWCRDCHEEEETELGNRNEKKEEPLTPERW